MFLKNETQTQQYVSNIFNNINTEIPIVQQITYHATPPWLTNKIDVNLDLSKHVKAETSSQTYRKLFSDLIAKYKYHKIYYTDAAKTKNSCKIVICADTETKSYCLPNNTDIFQAEAEAIYKCLKLAKATNYNKIIICSDALSTLLALNNSYSKHPTIQKIQDTIHNISSQNNRQITLVWVPSHVGIEGNEKADSAATSEEVTEDELIVTLPTVNNIKMEVKHNLDKIRLTKWLDTPNNKLMTLKKDIKSWTSGASRREQVVMTRLRIGHTRLTHGYLMANLEFKMCETCNVILTVEHLLTECHEYAYFRHKHNLPPNIAEILKIDHTITSKVINYLKDIKLLDQI